MLQIGLKEVIGLVHSRQSLEFYPDGQASLQFSQHIARLARVKRPGADEEHVIRLHVALLGAHNAAFYDW